MMYHRIFGDDVVTIMTVSSLYIERMAKDYGVPLNALERAGLLTRFRERKKGGSTCYLVLFDDPLGFCNITAAERSRQAVAEMRRKRRIAIDYENDDDEDEGDGAPPPKKKKIIELS